MCNALTVTKRESAPLPERLCERITYSTAMFAIWVNFSDKFVQCEGADHRYYSTPEMQNILLQNAVGHAVRKAKNFAGGATDTIFSGRPVLINYSCSLALRRWSSSRATVTSCPISSAALTPIFSTCASASSEETRGFSPLPSAWRRAISPRTAVTIKFALVSPGCRDASMPLTTSCGNLAFSCCDLLLTELVDMFAPPINNGMQCNTKVNTKKDLNWYSPKCNLNTTRADTCNSAIETTKPRTVGAVTGLLTKPLNEVTIMAGTQHTQTHPKFIYTFLAVHRDCIADGKNTVHVAADTLVDACEMLNDMGYISATWKGREENTLFIQKCENNFIWRFIALSTAQPRVIHIEATSEQEARQQSPDGCVMVFAARIRQEVEHV
ncbi:host cell division inhibitor Icd-like protein [Escherichia coli]|nr:host cell division inhibitor Icd-like protein [Escherichia coli]MCT9885112.1 host cell division inhibitor Icd-like protein [Escherichia coli]MDC6278037.1 host cell division inhibitor Icd-like protein [Escherichia coli]